MNAVVIVAVGGGIGAAARYLANVAAGRLLGTAFPYGTLLVNVVGSLAMGLLVGLFARRGASMELRLFLATGVLGGFTTFSAFSADAVALFERGDVAIAGGYVVGSVVLSIAALAAGLGLVRVWA
jgi:CrcB protein